MQSEETALIYWRCGHSGLVQEYRQTSKMSSIALGSNRLSELPGGVPGGGSFFSHAVRVQGPGTPPVTAISPLSKLPPASGQGFRDSAELEAPVPATNESLIDSAVCVMGDCGLTATRSSKLENVRVLA